MHFLKSPLNNWLFASLFLIAIGSCEMDSQLSSLESVSKGATEDEDLQNLNDSAQFRMGNIIYEETFEGSNPFTGQYITRHLAGSHSFNTATSPVLEGGKSGRFELRKGDPVVTKTGIRTQIAIRNTLLRQLQGEGWYSLGMYFPSDNFVPDDDDESITNWKPESNDDSYVSLRVRNDRFQIRFDKEYIDLGRVTKDFWHQFVFHIRHSTGSDGFFEVWQNGEKVFSRRGRTSRGDTNPRWVIGIYKATWQKRHTNTSKRVVYYDNIKVGNRNASYEEMIPSRNNLSDPSKNPTDPVELNKGLVGHWKMDEGSGNRLVDHSGRNNNATIVDPSGVSWVNGKVGSALRMASPSSRGRYFSTVPHNSSLNITDAITISAWIKPTTKANQTIVSKIPNGYELMTFEDGTIEFRLNRESDGSTYRLRSTKRYPTDGKTWMHVTATFDGRSSVLYINGEADFSAGYGSAKIKTNSNPVTIGARNTMFRWEGDLDDVRIYNRALSAAEAKSLVTGEPNSGSNSSVSGPSSPATSAPAPAPSPSIPQDIGSGLVGFWKMDERGGNTLIDNSGNRNNATIVDPSGVSWVTGKDGSAIRMASPSSRGRYFSRVPHNSSLNITQAITIAAWIKPTSTGNMMIASKTPNGYELGTFENGKIEFRLNRESDGSRYRLRSNKSYPSNGSTWMHVAATFDGSKSTIYINGVADNSTTYGKTQIRSNTNPLMIGAKGVNYRWEGDLDNVMIYNRALSASEIANLAR